MNREPVTARLVLLCHGPTAATRAAAFPTADEPVEPAALRRLAATAHGIAADRCLCSPALRARQTAAALRLDARPVPALRDLDGGAWAGRRLDDLPPEALAAWLADPDTAPPGGESLAGLRHRVAAWLQACPAGRTLAVTHAAVIRAAILHALSAPPAAFWRIDVPPLAIIRLGGHAGRWNLAGFGTLPPARNLGEAAPAQPEDRPCTSP